MTLAAPHTHTGATMTDYFYDDLQYGEAEDKRRSGSDVPDAENGEELEEILDDIADRVEQEAQEAEEAEDE